jgi:hypothetical protein
VANNRAIARKNNANRPLIRQDWNRLQSQFPQVDVRYMIKNDLDSKKIGQIRLFLTFRIKIELKKNCDG